MEEKDLIETRKVLEEMGNETLSSMRDILFTKDKNASGELINSLKYTIDYNNQSLDIEFEMADYGIFVDKGRRPGKMPPIDKIKPWMQLRGIPEKWAFPIARKIGKLGIPATPFFSSTIEEKQTLYINKLADAFATDLENYTQKLL